MHGKKMINRIKNHSETMGLTAVFMRMISLQRRKAYAHTHTPAHTTDGNCKEVKKRL